MCAWRRGYDGASYPIFPSWPDGIHPDYREAARAAVAEDEVKLHGYAAAVTSSQAFALNLFIPWRTGARAALDADLVEEGRRQHLVVRVGGDPQERPQGELLPHGAAGPPERCAGR